MSHLNILTVLAVLTLFSFARQATAQTVPSTVGIHAYSSQARFMSLAGYLRWQYFQENNVWISRAEAGELSRTQANGPK